MAAYAEQVLICTGKDDWPSKIETEGGGNVAQTLKGLLGRGGDGNVAQILKGLLGRGGKFCDVCPSPYNALDMTWLLTCTTLAFP